MVNSSNENRENTGNPPAKIGMSIPLNKIGSTSDGQNTSGRISSKRDVVGRLNLNPAIKF